MGVIKMEKNFEKIDEKYNALRDKFIDEVIMQPIHELPDSKKSMILPAVNGWFQGNSFKFSTDYSKSEVDIHLTNLILTKLRTLGFWFEFKMTNTGNEFRNGEGIIEIDWSNVKF